MIYPTCTRCPKPAQRDHTMCKACLKRYWADMRRRRRKARLLIAWGDVIGVVVGHE